MPGHIGHCPVLGIFRYVFLNDGRDHITMTLALALALLDKEGWHTRFHPGALVPAGINPRNTKQQRKEQGRESGGTKWFCRKTV